MISKNFGWNGAFTAFIATSIIGAVIFLFTWNKRSPVLDDIHNDNATQQTS